MCIISLAAKLNSFERWDFDEVVRLLQPDSWYYLIPKLLCLAGNIFICHKLAVSGPAGQEESDSEDEFSPGVVYKIGRF